MLASVYVSSTSGVASPGVAPCWYGLCRGVVGFCCCRLDAHCCALNAHSAGSADVFWAPLLALLPPDDDDNGGVGLGEFITGPPAAAAAAAAGAPARQQFTKILQLMNGLVQSNQRQYARIRIYINTQDDSDVISFHIYASWFSPPSCG